MEDYCHTNIRIFKKKEPSRTKPKEGENSVTPDIKPTALRYLPKYPRLSQHLTYSLSRHPGHMT